MSTKIKNYPGEELKGADIRAGKVPVVRFRPRIRYSWTRSRYHLSKIRWWMDFKIRNINVNTTCFRSSCIIIRN